MELRNQRSEVRTLSGAPYFSFVFNSLATMSPLLRNGENPNCDKNVIVRAIVRMIGSVLNVC